MINNKKISLNKCYSALSLNSSNGQQSCVTNTQSNNSDRPRHIQLPPSLKSSLKTPKSASAPCSPLKSVSFHQQLEDVRLFKRAQTPLAISQSIFWDSSEEPDLTFPNWSLVLNQIIDRAIIKIDKQHFELIDQTLVGTIAVKNLTYHKQVFIRYTFDFWKTVQEVEASFDRPSSAQYDLFQFRIFLKDTDYHLYFAVHYKADDRDYWENNEGRNYEVLIHRNRPMTPTDNLLKTRYDFSQSIQQTKHQPEILQPTPVKPSIPSSLGDLNSQSYLDLVNKYCFYSPSPSQSPVSTHI